MSVRENHYIIYGVRLPYIKPEDMNIEDEDGWYDRTEPFRADGREGKAVYIDDAMSGGYAIMGHCFAATEEYCGFGVVELPRLDIGSAEQITRFAKWKTEIEEMIDTLGIRDYLKDQVERNGLDLDFRWIVFTNCR